MGEVMIYRLLKNYFNAEEFHMKETIPNYKWCLCMIRFPSGLGPLGWSVKWGGGGGLLFSVVYSAFESIWD